MNIKVPATTKVFAYVSLLCATQTLRSIVPTNSTIAMISAQESWIPFGIHLLVCMCVGSSEDFWRHSTVAERRRRAFIQVYTPRMLIAMWECSSECVATSRLENRSYTFCSIHSIGFITIHIYICCAYYNVDREMNSPGGSNVTIYFPNQRWVWGFYGVDLRYGVCGIQDGKSYKHTSTPSLFGGNEIVDYSEHRRSDVGKWWFTFTENWE